METNKDRLIKFAKVLSVILFILIAIISNVAVWNNAATIEGIAIVASIINFIIEIGVGAFIFRKLTKD